MTKPVRLQRKRVKGWRIPPDAVYVGRSTKWANHVRVGFGMTAARACQLFRAAWEQELILRPETTREILNELRGKDLVCWCPLSTRTNYVHCHADVLIELANEDAP